MIEHAPDDLYGPFERLMRRIKRLIAWFLYRHVHGWLHTIVVWGADRLGTIEHLYNQWYEDD